jgi:hypothetical protein
MTRWYLLLLMALERLSFRMLTLLIAIDEIIAHGDGVIDVALASRRRCAIEHYDLCGVLTDCM